LDSCHYSVTPLLHHCMPKVIVAPSILAADFSRLADEVHRVEQAGADWIHCDIMDGHFVDNISFGPDIVGIIRKETKLPLDVHLMIQTPDHYAPRFVKAGANSITVHVEREANHDVEKTLRVIRDRPFACHDGPSWLWRAIVPARNDGESETCLGMEQIPRTHDRRGSGRRHQCSHGAIINPKWRQRARSRHINFPRERLRKGDSRPARLGMTTRFESSRGYPAITGPARLPRWFRPSLRRFA
jgi:hypothetical protein